MSLRAPSPPRQGSQDRDWARGGRRRIGSRGVVPWLFLAPYLLFLAALGIAPALYAVFLSFSSSDAAGAVSFVGTRNWVGALTDFRFPAAAVHVGAYLVLWLPTLAVLVIAISLVLHSRPGRFSTTMRSIYYLPGAVTGSAAALVWLFMLSADVSPAGPLLRSLGLNDLTTAVSGARLPPILAIMGIAIHAGGWIVIVYGALASLPHEVMEASLIDGCNSWQQAIHIKLPLIRRYVILILISTLASGTQVFVEPTVLDIGAPGQIGPTWSINQLAYYFATQYNNFGQAAVLSLVLLLLGLVLALVIIFRTDFYRVEA